MNEPWRTLLGVLDRSRPVLVQAHDFPDHDAIASAYALGKLLARAGFDCALTAGGQIQSISLTAMIRELDIPLEPFGSACADAKRQTILVDGSSAGGTIKTVAGALTGVIDHHPARRKIACPFIDVRTDAGSCSAIIWSYWAEAGEVPDRAAATALLAGIQLDTDFLSRGVSPLDLKAHYELFYLGSHELAREVVRTSLSVDQLADIGRAFSSFLRDGNVLVTEVSGDYSSELLSVLADFLLRLREVSFVIVIEVKGDEYLLSARSRDREIDAGFIVRRMLAGIGTGGGHAHMAGGVIRPGDYPGAGALLERAVDEIRAYRSTDETESQAD